MCRQDSSKVTILHVNDVHSRFAQLSIYGGPCSDDDANEGKCYGGFSRVDAALKQLRQTDPNVIFMGAGDFYVGTVWFTIHKWRILADLLPKLQLDVMSFGNHEFDDGIPGIVPFLEGVKGKIPVVTANLNASAVPSMDGLFTASTIITRGDRKVGVVGFLTPSTKYISKPGDLLVFTDEVEAVREAAKELRSQGVKTIVALGHSGFSIDQKIAKEVEDIDMVVGGHSNTFLYNGTDPSIEVSVDTYPVVVEQASGKRVPVVQAFAYTKYLGRLVLDLDDEGRITGWEGNPILLDSSFSQDPEMEELLKPYREEVEKSIQEQVGETLVFLDARRPACRLMECNLGNFVADSFVHKYAVRSDDGWGQAALAVVNSGAIRISISENDVNAGKVTMGDVLTILPFEGTVDLVDLTGDDVKRMFEYSVHDYNPNNVDPDGHFLQVSGFKVVYDYSKPVGSRVVELMARCLDCRVPEMKPVTTNEIYRIAMRDFMASGGDGYDVIKLNKTGHIRTGFLESDVLAEFVKTRSPIYPGIEGRTTFINSENSRTNIADEEKYYSKKHGKYMSPEDLYRMSNQRMNKKDTNKQ